MKDRFFYFILLAVALLTPVPASAWYYAIGGGGGGEADATNFSAAIGKEDIKIGDWTAIAAVTVPLILHGSGNVPSSTSDSACPHGDCSSIGDKEDGTEVGLIGSFGLELFDWSTHVSLLTGITRVNMVEVSQSNTNPGTYYTEGSDTEYELLYGLGVSYTPVFFEWKLKMIFSLELDNRRGLTGMIGWCW